MFPQINYSPVYFGVRKKSISVTTEPTEEKGFVPEIKNTGQGENGYPAILKHVEDNFIKAPMFKSENNLSLPSTKNKTMDTFQQPGTNEQEKLKVAKATLTSDQQKIFDVITTLRAESGRSETDTTLQIRQLEIIEAHRKKYNNPPLTDDMRSATSAYEKVIGKTIHGKR